MSKFLKRVLIYAYKILAKERDKWESGLKNNFLEFESDYSRLLSAIGITEEFMKEVYKNEEK